MALRNDDVVQTSYFHLQGRRVHLAEKRPDEVPSPSLRSINEAPDCVTHRLIVPDAREVDNAGLALTAITPTHASKRHREHLAALFDHPEIPDQCCSEHVPVRPHLVRKSMRIFELIL